MEGLLLPILLFGALGLMMYAGMRKQKKQIADTKAMQDSLVPGTRVMTTSGLHGTVTAVADDTIELEIAPDIYTTWVRAAVRQVIVPGLGEGGASPLAVDDVAETTVEDAVVDDAPRSDISLTKDPARPDAGRRSDLN